MNRFEIESHREFDHHEVVEVRNSGDLHAIIAVHNTNLGPAVGGCRMYPYSSEADALTDVLRLSRGMTYKSALAGIPLGGGKAVIIGDPRADKSEALLHAMGDFIETLGGRYITAEDSGTGVNDIKVIGERTAFVSGIADNERFGGDPSPITALGVFEGIAASVLYRCKSDLAGIRVGVQGVGNVGYHLVGLLRAAGAIVTVADVNQGNLDRVTADHAVDVVSPDAILSAEVDVLAPCAMGGAINPETIRSIRAGIIAGAANNQLSAREIGADLLDMGILYAPDYVINAGGIIDVYYQRIGERDEALVKRHVAEIGTTLDRIFRISDMERRPTSDVADQMAEAIFSPELQAA